MCKIKDAMERGDYPQTQSTVCEICGSAKRKDGSYYYCKNSNCPSYKTDEDDDSADEAYERSKEEERYFTKAYGHHEEN